MDRIYSLGMKYAVVEIAGRQYQVLPNQELMVNHLGDIKSFQCDRVLLISDEKKIKIGQPFLKDKLEFSVLGNVRGKKIRVATYKAKVNYRKVKGSRATYSKIVLA